MKCAYCGKVIRKHTTTVYLEQKRSELHRNNTGSRHIYPDEMGIPWPRTMADCQKLSNQKVTSIYRGAVWNKSEDTIVRGDLVRSFNEWDGERYLPSYRYFCTNYCAGWFACEAVERLTKGKVA